MASIDTLRVLSAVFSYFLAFHYVNTSSDFDLNFGLDGDGGDFLDTIGSMADSLAEAFGDKECIFRCENGGVPRTREDHEPRTNGCGSFGLQMDTSELPEMTACCDSHDYCYDTCNSEKASCDKNFKQCLDDMCENMEEKLNQKEYEGCLATAELMYQGTVKLGCQSFKQGQEDACICEKKEKEKSSSKDQIKSQPEAQIKRKSSSRKSGEL